MWVGLASIPERERSLERSVASLLPHVDRVCVHLNRYRRMPSFLRTAKVRVTWSRQDGDLGDAGKFMQVAHAPGYFLACDDDLAYPPDYAASTVAAIERHARRAVVGYYGRLLSSRGLQIERYHFVGDQAEERRVHVLGSGVCGLYAPELLLSVDDFPEPNMADIWLGLWAQRRRVPLVVLPHPGDWLRQTTHERSICSESLARTGSSMDTSSRQQSLCASIVWELPP